MNYILPIIQKFGKYMSIDKNVIKKIYSIEELSAENEKLRRRITELQSTINKSTKKVSRKSKKRNLDFTMYKMRHVALKFCYLGWSYCGVAQQLNEENTIIEKIYEALELCKLIENRENSDIVICGRTDKGVSAFQQVISLSVRSNLCSPKGVIENTGININKRKSHCYEEIDYVFLLNKVLPKDIRMLAWSPTEVDFSARFNCTGRSYKYFFTKSDLCIESMREAAEKLIGEHDFRNFCSMQIRQGIKHFVRRIFRVNIEPYSESDEENAYRIYVIDISASAFVYHQIRCIVAVLMMVGQKKETPDVVEHLLDINGIGGLGKPLYQMASDLPLVFYDAFFEDLDWQTSPEALNDYLYDIQNLWVNFQTKQSILKLFLDEINVKHSSEIIRKPLIHAIMNDSKGDKWKPLLKRQKEITLEEKIENKKLKESSH